MRHKGAVLWALGGACGLAATLVVGRTDLFGRVATGDAKRGSYVQDAALADEAAAGVERITRAAEPLATPSPAAGTDWRPSEPLEARPAPAEAATGALFSPGLDWDGDHHCSGSVVHSPGGDLIATAAHCVYQGGFRTNLAFVPGYRDGAAPYGVWVPTRVEVDPRWVEASDPDHDVAFIRVRGVGQPGRRLEEVTGAHPLGLRPELPTPARLVGYPNDTEEPLGCANTAEPDGPTQLRLDCADVPNGTSGGPVLSAAGALIGVIGGRDGGGDELTSYSSYFGAGTEALYERATRD
ncbi:trypsin-like peptidase domain-containing protein [Streptomyces sp. RerS4]|uniref:trypsin-like serine peptidase n=1 Tax=Streptomyces sp. RerS4 TaxID=2942449 RepID=UPI00201C9734|nr:trypsin-like peptidase domain-containing protein [Streptomyces sp. RerS4]UQX03691.1 serine protease [Streptomyces sp. RerS4]